MPLVQASHVVNDRDAAIGCYVDPGESELAFRLIIWGLVGLPP
jgi:hypothetical protein